MNPEKISQAITTGLVAGYGGQTEFTKITRGSFDVKSSHFQNDEIIYHDEWTNSGGQELVKVGNDMFTRVYAGNVVDSEILNSLGITEEDVINNLKNRIVELGNHTRLFADYQAKNIDGWDYEYKILDSTDQIPVTTGKEIISYKNQIVFVHIFVLTPIK